ncbi:MAG: MYXO-CTERM sorting domain-containing protein, partial [Proteobacteria bacterium]|nr:MYXO-CTERM sorting domain-containing protein [Pseudomonadota bacterium]
TDTCVGGRCVPGSGVQGGLGSMCANNEACASGLCVNGDSNGMVCSDTCELDVANSCPAGFQCIAAGSIAVCYPGGDDGGGCVSGGAPTGPIVFGLAFGALVLRRRRTSTV